MIFLRTLSIVVIGHCLNIKLLKVQIKKWKTCRVQPSSYGCTREVAKLERT